LYNSISEYQQQLFAGKVTCQAVVAYYLEKINNQLHLNAFTEVYEAAALERAAILDDEREKGKPSGKLHGVVIAIKDVICFKDHKVTAASKILEGFISVYNATAVQRLLDEGAIIIGSCNCDEFAMGSTNENSVYGPVLNAIDESKVPGGSSGGSAVAVQADLCMVSLGSDTGGSVRQPADFCGIIGLKPTYGRISRYGLIAYASSFDQIGIFGTQVADVALILEVIAGADEYDSTALEQPLIPEHSNKETPYLPPLLNVDKEKKYRIAYFDVAVNHPSLDQEIGAAIKSCLQELSKDGHTVEAVSFDLLDHIVPAYYVLTTAEASSNLSRFDGIRFGHATKEKIEDLTDFYKLSRSEGFGKEVKRRIMLGTFVLSSGYYDAYFTKAQQVRRILVDKMNEIFKDFDAVILPTSPTTAPAIGDSTDDPIAMYLADIYTVFANLTGLPAISVPLFKHSNGMPFGLQVTTNKKEELTLLQISNLLLQQYNTAGKIYQ
jgi:aspartyl-tRNA(Asn)/glutamyl-tRNA(Gln) amidotransferase subunit A